MPSIVQTGDPVWAKVSWTCGNCRSRIRFNETDLPNLEIEWMTFVGNSTPTPVEIQADCPKCQRWATFTNS